MYPWGDHSHDVQMKWIALLLGIVFVALFVWFSTALHRFKKLGRGLIYDASEQLLTWWDCEDRHEWRLNDVLGLQLIHHYVTSQLILVVRENDEARRALVHHDLHHRIDKLVADFSHWTGLKVISDVRHDAKSDNKSVNRSDRQRV